jgi:hypothetical protein
MANIEVPKKSINLLGEPDTSPEVRQKAREEVRAYARGASAEQKRELAAVLEGAKPHKDLQDLRRELGVPEAAKPVASKPAEAPALPNLKPAKEILKAAGVPAAYVDVVPDGESATDKKEEPSILSKEYWEKKMDDAKGMAVGAGAAILGVWLAFKGLFHVKTEKGGKETMPSKVWKWSKFILGGGFLVYGYNKLFGKKDGAGTGDGSTNPDGSPANPNGGKKENPPPSGGSFLTRDPSGELHRNPNSIIPDPLNGAVEGLARAYDDACDLLGKQGAEVLWRCHDIQQLFLNRKNYASDVTFSLALLAAMTKNGIGFAFDETGIFLSPEGRLIKLEGRLVGTLYNAVTGGEWKSGDLVSTYIEGIILTATSLAVLKAISIGKFGKKYPILRTSLHWPVDLPLFVGRQGKGLYRVGKDVFTKEGAIKLGAKRRLLTMKRVVLWPTKTALYGALHGFSEDGLKLRLELAHEHHKLSKIAERRHFATAEKYSTTAQESASRLHEYALKLEKQGKLPSWFTEGLQRKYGGNANLADIGSTGLADAFEFLSPPAETEAGGTPPPEKANEKTGSGETEQPTAEEPASPLEEEIEREFAEEPAETESAKSAEEKLAEEKKPAEEKKSVDEKKPTKEKPMNREGRIQATERCLTDLERDIRAYKAGDTSRLEAIHANWAELTVDLVEVAPLREKTLSDRIGIALRDAADIVKTYKPVERMRVAEQRLRTLEQELSTLKPDAARSTEIRAEMRRSILELNKLKAAGVVIDAKAMSDALKIVEPAAVVAPPSRDVRPDDSRVPNNEMTPDDIERLLADAEKNKQPQPPHTIETEPPPEAPSAKSVSPSPEKPGGSGAATITPVETTTWSATGTLDAPKRSEVRLPSEAGSPLQVLKRVEGTLPHEAGTSATRMGKQFAKDAGSTGAHG